LDARSRFPGAGGANVPRAMEDTVSGLSASLRRARKALAGTSTMLRLGAVDTAAGGRGAARRGHGHVHRARVGARLLPSPSRRLSRSLALPSNRLWRTTRCRPNSRPPLIQTGRRCWCCRTVRTTSP
jgi:hypothetical protein